MTPRTPIIGHDQRLRTHHARIAEACREVTAFAGRLSDAEDFEFHLPGFAWSYSSEASSYSQIPFSGPEELIQLHLDIEAWLDRQAAQHFAAIPAAKVKFTTASQMAWLLELAQRGQGPGRFEAIDIDRMSARVMAALGYTLEETFLGDQSGPHYRLDRLDWNASIAALDDQAIGMARRMLGYLVHDEAYARTGCTRATYEVADDIAARVVHLTVEVAFGSARCELRTGDPTIIIDEEGILLSQAMPETALNGLIGAALEELTDHPAASGLGIAITGQQGTERLLHDARRGDILLLEV